MGLLAIDSFGRAIALKYSGGGRLTSIGQERHLDAAEGLGVEARPLSAFLGRAQVIHVARRPNERISLQDLKEKKNIPFHLEINGETVQTGNSNKMIHSFDRIISFVSQYITLKKGEPH